MKGIIYYTDNRLEKLDRDQMLPGLVQKYILQSGLPIVSCSLKPMDFGTNVVLDLEPGVLTMYKQMYKALEVSTADEVFFCEHDVLYHPSHFEFTPERADTFYYNTNVWRCHPRRNICITYNEIQSVSGICVNRKTALEHYAKRIEHIYKKGFDKLPSRNPRWARAMGYEPGKPVSAGGFIEEKTEIWKSASPNIDIRHRLTMTTPKLHVEDFVHEPTDWKQVTIDEIPDWNLRELFEL